jgi:uncharacterized membrane protein (DUF485 family)
MNKNETKKILAELLKHDMLYLVILGFVFLVLYLEFISLVNTESVNSGSINFLAGLIAGVLGMLWLFFLLFVFIINKKYSKEKEVIK